MSEPFIPTKEADLRDWSDNFAALIKSDPTDYGLTEAQATAYETLNTSFASAYAIATNPPTRTNPTIIAKNDAKALLIANARELAGIIQNYPGTTNQQRANLGLNVPDVEPTPVPVPTSPPSLTIVSTLGRTVKLRLRDIENPVRRGKPDGVVGSIIFQYVGENPPDNPSDWTYLANTSRTLIDLEFPFTVAAGTKVWLTAFWYNRKTDAGPSATPVSTRFADAVAQQQAA